jgi:menaquinol-cytochrome c reductase iron-sulfur subunit
MGIEDQCITRRQVSVRAIYGLTSIVGAFLGAPAVMYLFSAPGSNKKTGWIDAGETSSLRPGTPVQVPIQRIWLDGWRIRNVREMAWVVVGPDRSITAFSSFCTHLGCAYRWREDKALFECPCHGSWFSKSGQVVSGPAPRGLDRYDVKVDENRLWLGQLRRGENPRS